MEAGTGAGKAGGEPAGIWGGEEVGGLATDGTQKLSKRDQLRTVPWVLAWAAEELGCRMGLGMLLRGAGSRGAG